MTQAHVPHRIPEKAAEEEQGEIPHKDVDAEKLKADLDAIIDEIDDVLSEEEAAATVASYIQKGGQ